jgi:hypothetical protein
MNRQAQLQALALDYSRKPLQILRHTGLATMSRRGKSGGWTDVRKWGLRFLRFRLLVERAVSEAPICEALCDI